MMKKKNSAYVLVLLTVLAVPLFAQTKVTPVANIDLLGGQYWVTGSAPASFAGNAYIFFSPVINFNSSTALLPIYSGSYSGTKDVRELVGGGTLTREIQNHSLSLKFVKKLPAGMKLKASTGYKIEYLKETVDESWGNGLFDSARASLGVEAEKPLERWNIRAGLDYYTMSYPNYQALITKDEFQTALDTTTNLELSTQAGTNVLDYATYAFFAEGVHGFSSQVTGLVRYNLALKDFSDQNTVLNTGEFSKTKRADTVHYLSAALSLATPRITVGFNDTVQLYDSNQNSFDVANSKYVPDYYDFMENAFAPKITFNLGQGDKPIKLLFFWELAYRAYSKRLAQNADASYKADKITQTINTTGFGLTYPVTGNLAAKFQANYSNSVSNMKYEKNYKYNYYTLNYFAGISWAL